MLSLDNIVWRQEPYKIGLARPVMADGVYEQLASTFPPESIMAMLGKNYVKLCLSERARPGEYLRYVKSCIPWWRFYKYVKSPAFLEQVQPIIGPGEWKTRFEFSSMPADGGKIDPHTDIPSKVLTLIVPMIKTGDCWDASWGGGTDVLRAINPIEKLEDYKAPLYKFDRVYSYGYAPNQCVVFIKAYNSWHSVGPMKGPHGAWRRSITINVERI